MPGFEDCQSLLNKLGKHKHAKSCLYVNQLADIDNKVLEQLVSRSITDMRKRYRCS